MGDTGDDDGGIVPECPSRTRDRIPRDVVHQGASCYQDRTLLGSDAVGEAQPRRGEVDRRALRCAVLGGWLERQSRGIPEKLRRCDLSVELDPDLRRFVDELHDAILSRFETRNGPATEKDSEQGCGDPQVRFSPFQHFKEAERA